MRTNIASAAVDYFAALEAGQYRVNEKVRLGISGENEWGAVELTTGSLELTVEDRGAGAKKETEGVKDERKAAEEKRVSDKYREALFKAARKGWTKTVRKLLDRGVDVNVRNSERETALPYAIVNSSEPPVAMVRVLIDWGADVNAANVRRETALHAAARKAQESWNNEGHIRKRQDWPGRWLEIVQLLIDAGANVNARNEKRDTPLLVSTRELRWQPFRGAYLELYELLIGRGADVNDYGRGRKSTALFFAIKGGEIELTRMLLEAGADPMAPIKWGAHYYTAVETAEREHQDKIAEMLREYIGRNSGARLAATKRRFGGIIRQFARAIRDGDDQGLMEVAAVSHCGEPMWPKWADELRAVYEGSYELLDDIAGGGTLENFGSVLLARPEGSERKYTQLSLMEFPDGKWRVIKYRRTDRGPEYAGEHLDSATREPYRRAVFDAAGRFQELAEGVGDAVKTEDIKFGGRVIVTVEDGYLRLNFFDPPEGEPKALEFYADRLKWWLCENWLYVVKNVTTKGDSLRLEAHAADGTATLSSGDKKYVVDAHEGKVRVRFEGKVLKAEKFTFELPGLELQPAE